MLKKMISNICDYAEGSFISPMPIRSPELRGIRESVVYAYLIPTENSPFKNNNLVYKCFIDDTYYDVIYVGETSDLSRRHNQHLQKWDVCNQFNLSKLLLPPFSPIVNLREYKNHPNLVRAYENHAPGAQISQADRERNVNSSIGWSLISYITLLKVVDDNERAVVERALISVWNPILNRK